MKRSVLVTGAGGFIGSHMVKYLKDRGYWVRGVDLKWPEFFLVYIRILNSMICILMGLKRPPSIC